ncbi:MAG TPA: GNAT family N-acetyltransferase [Thermoanaerobaculia bacterium]
MSALDGVAAVERISRECFRSFTHLPGARLIDDGRVFGALTDVPINFFSGIATSRLSEDEVPGIVEMMSARPFRWWISPASRPENLASILVGLGLQHTYDSTGMTIELRAMDDGAMPDGLTIRRVTDLEDWERAFIPGFGRPESDRGVWRTVYPQCGDVWTHFAGYLEGEPVATTSLLFCGDLAGVYHVVTLPSARGRGIGRAMTVAALHHARELGSTHAALQSSKMGLGVYRSIGFIPCCDLTLYTWRP